MMEPKQNVFVFVFVLFFVAWLIVCGSTDQGHTCPNPQARLVFANGTQRYQDIRTYMFFFRNKEKQVSTPFATCCCTYHVRHATSHVEHLWHVEFDSGSCHFKYVLLCCKTGNSVTIPRPLCTLFNCAPPLGADLCVRTRYQKEHVHSRYVLVITPVLHTGGPKFNSRLE